MPGTALMITATSLLIFLWATPAVARPPLPQPSVDPCANETAYTSEAMNGMRFSEGNGSGDTEADALKQARNAARDALLDLLQCGGANDIGNQFGDIVRLNIEPWKGRSKPSRHHSFEACATAAISKDYLAQLQSQSDRLGQDMHALAQQITTGDR